MSEPKKPLDRFAHLERERKGELEEKVAPSAAHRFGAVEQGREQPVQVPAGAGVKRFDAPAMPDDVAVEAHSDEEQPFVKCAACGNESGKFAQWCPICGADFNTEQQRDFNARVWAERKAQLDAERAATAAREARLMDEAQHRHDGKRALGEAIAREVRENEERRILLDELSGRDARYAPRMGGSPLLGWLGRLPSPWSWVVGLGTVVLPLLLAQFGRTGGAVFKVGVAWLVLDVVLLIPPGWWFLPSRRTRWWDDW